MGRRKTVYSVHPSIAMVQTWVAGLEASTGRSLAAWLALVRKKGPADEAARRAWLKEEHGLGDSGAWWIAERSFGRGLEDDDPELYLKAAEAYVEAMYAGKKAGLRPIYDALLDLCVGLGKDVRICPAKTLVPVYRRHVIAEIKPSTLTRIDFGLALGPVKTTSKRLIATGGPAKKDRITHRFAIGHLGEVDAEVVRWLTAAYERDAESGVSP
jgi:hypothetical protein